MEVKTRERNNIIIFDIKGDIRRSEINIVTLHQQVKDQLKAGKINFLLNFEKVAYIDSFGVGELIASYKSIHDVGGKFKITKMPTKIRFLFKITMMEKIFEIFDEEETAIRSFSK